MHLACVHITHRGLSREAVLGHVAKLVKEFVYQACIRRNLSESAARAAGGKIFTFGSYRLGVHGPGSDIDTLIVAPKHVDRQDFIEIFLNILQNDDWVTEANVRRNSLYGSCRCLTPP
jgi:poly(A) polymerase